MEEGFDEEGAPAFSDFVAAPQLPGAKADPGDRGSRPNRKRGRDVLDWGADAEPDPVAAARGRDGRVSCALPVRFIICTASLRAAVTRGHAWPLSTIADRIAPSG